MSNALDSQQVEIVGRNWLVHELMLAGFEVALPMRDNGVDFFVSPSDYAWTMPVQLKTHRDTYMNVYPKYLGKNLIVAYVMLGDAMSALPSDEAGVYHIKAKDYSARTIWMTPEEAWRLPTEAGQAQDLENDPGYRFAWTTVIKKNLIPDMIALHRGQFRSVVNDAHRRLLEPKADIHQTTIPEWIASQKAAEKRAQRGDASAG